MRRIKNLFALLLALVLTVGALPVSAAAVDTGFTDVPNDAYYADAVEWAVEEEITNGTGNGAFSPEKTVTRAEAVTLLWRAAGCPSPTAAASGFSDVTDQDAYYYDAVLWAVENGITNGVGGGRFSPTGTLAYDQILTFLYRLDGEKTTGSDWSATAVSWARNNGLTDGLTFAAKASCPRADVVYCLWKQLENGEQNLEEQESQDPEQPVLSDEAGATLTIITGFLDRKAAIDIGDFGLEASQAEKLALELADIDGKNPYGISHLNAYEQDGRLAKTLAVYYTGSTVSNTTAADHDWRYISDAALAEADRVVDVLVTNSMSDYDVVKVLHDYLVTHCDYDYRVDIGNMPFVSHQAEGALLKGTAVCSGYAKAYEALLDAAGIPNETITGFAGGYHAWNLVQVDGQWYHVDTTWDDPTTRGGDYICYRYFLKSDKVMVSRSHRDWEAVYNCTSTKYDKDLLDSVDQALADERQERVDTILAACAPALANIPTWTQSELQALSSQELNDALYYIIDLSDSGFDSNTLSKYSREVTDAICAQHPEFSYGAFYSSKMTFEFLRTEVSQEQQRRKDAAQAEKEHQAAQDAVDAVEIQKLLEQAIVNGTCETYEITLTGYTDDAIELACKNMKVEGYSFGDYTYTNPAYTSDFDVTAKSGGIVRISNHKWGQAELQRYVDQVEAAIRQGQARVALQPGNYPDKDDNYYAVKAIRQVAAEGYAFDGLTAGVDYMLGNPGTDVNSRVTAAHIDYPFLADMTEEAALDYLVQQIRAAIQRGDTQVYLPTDFGDNSYFRLPSEACSIIREETGYVVRVASTSVAGDCTVTISQAGEA